MGGGVSIPRQCALIELCGILRRPDAALDGLHSDLCSDFDVPAPPIPC